MQRCFLKYISGKCVFLILGILLPNLKTSAQDYFQQEINYNIHVTLHDKNHELNGFEFVKYLNNSPDTLRFLYFHLWPNAYSNNKTELAKQILRFNGKTKLFNDPELRGYIDSLGFKADDKDVQWNLLPGFPDICKIILNKPLKHGDSICITTPFHVKIPKGLISLLGHIGESYQISQWYPKPAVYDRAGWHQMPYLDQGEFYSEFGSFDVSITLPDNYIVGATGNLLNEEEVKRLNSLSEDTSASQIQGYKETGFPSSSKQMKTLRFTMNQIHDFAWFADKRFHVRKGKVRLPDSGKEVTIWALFTNEAAGLWRNAISYESNAIRSFSKWIGDYPYDHYTAVQCNLSSGDGMEYPGLSVIGHANDGYSLDRVIAHEICHNWFYSSLGSDERRFPFMDESITSAYESRYMDEKYPGKKLWEVYFKNRKIAKFLQLDKMPVARMQELDWLAQARNNMEQPINLASPDFTPENYNIMIYNKAAQGFNYLRSYMGDSLFDSTMHDYYRKWMFKHPQPDDLRAIFQSHTNKDLTWFFDDFLGTVKRLDYKIIRLTNQKLLIKNKGELKGPLMIAGMIGDSICSKKWEDGFDGKKWINIPENYYSEIKIDPEHKMPELFRLNDNIRTSGIFRRADPVQIRYLYTVEDPDKRSLIFIPAFDWNRANGFMAGVALESGTLIPKPVEYFAMPFYAFRVPGFAGYGKISFNIAPYNNLIRVATFTLEGEQFGGPGNQNYHKMKAGINLNFRSDKMINNFNQSVFGYYLGASDLGQIELQSQEKIRSYLQLGYELERTGMINPFKIIVSCESGNSYQKTSLEFNYKYCYNSKNSGLEIRLFTGSMLNNSNPNSFYSFSAGGRSGPEEYLYQGFYPDRFGESPKSFWSRQMTLSEGGLVSPVTDSLGYSRWLCSLTLTSSLPGKVSWIPVKPFANLLLNDHSGGTINKSVFFFEAGFKAGLWNFFEIYFPFIVSDNVSAIAGSFKDRIRFIFKLDMLNSFRVRSKVAN